MINAVTFANHTVPTPTPTDTPTPTPTFTPTPTNTPSPTPAQKIVDHDDSSVKVKYDNWVGVEDVNASGGTYRTTYSKNHSISFSQTIISRSASVYAYRGSDQGKMQLWVDGKKVKELSLYRATPQYRYLITQGNLTNTKHKIEVRVLSTKAALSKGTYVRIDAFVDGDGKLIEDTNQRINFNSWRGVLDPTLPYVNGGYHVSGQKGAKLILPFTGDSIRWIVKECNQCGGQYRVLIDGQEYAVYSHYSPLPNANFSDENERGFGPGSHTFVIEVLGTHIGGTSNDITVDSFTDIE